MPFSRRPARCFCRWRRWVECGPRRGFSAGRRSRASPPPSSRATSSRSWSGPTRSEEHTSELQSLTNLVCRLLLEKKQSSGARELTFRKKANDLALRDSLRGFPDCVAGVTQIKWNAAHRSKNRIEDTMLINRRVDDIANRPRTGHLQENGVDPGDVIWQQKKALGRKMFAPNRRDAIKTASQADAQEVECAFTERHRSHRLWFTIGPLPTAIGNCMSIQQPRTGARTALALLLGINFFNYIDRYILASVEPSIRATFFVPGDPNAMAITGALGTAFIVSYMISAPALGWLADRFSRWVIIGSAVILWSLASGASGLAGSIAALFITRIFVGI